MNFDLSTQKYQKFALKWAAFDQSMFKIRKYREVMFDDTED